ncbi:MAG: DMT family transporter [Pseudomonadota bacterium]
MTRTAPFAAIGFMLTSALLIAGTTLVAKALGTGQFGTIALGPELHPLQVTFGRFLFAWIAVATAVAVMRPVLVRPSWKLHFARTICGAIGVTLMFAAAAAIPLADATAISFLNPVFAMILAMVALGERVGPWRWAAAAISLFGAMALIRPGGDGVQAGALLALAAAMILGVEITVIKYLSGRELPLQILLINNTIGLGLISVAVIAVWQNPTALQWVGLATLGLLMAGAQFCFVNAMARAEASFVAPFSYTTLIFAALYDFAIFGSFPAALSCSGIALILVGAGVLAWREATHKQRVQ